MPHRNSVSFLRPFLAAPVCNLVAIGAPHIKKNDGSDKNERRDVRCDVLEVIDAAKGAGVQRVGIITDGMRRAAGLP